MSRSRPVLLATASVAYVALPGTVFVPASRPLASSVPQSTVPVTDAASSTIGASSTFARSAVVGILLSGLGASLVSRSRGMRAATDLSEDVVTEEALLTKEEVAQKRKKKPPFTPAEQVGVVAPLGFFDPLGFSPIGKEKGFKTYREMEIKHGRIAMLASVGLVVQHFIHRPDVTLLKTYAGMTNPNGIGAMGMFIGNEGFIQLIGLAFFAMVMELYVWTGEFQSEPGNYGNPLGIPMYNIDMRNKEINNGRFAMICVLGIWAAELATGKDAVQQLGF